MLNELDKQYENKPNIRIEFVSSLEEKKKKAFMKNTFGTLDRNH